MPENFGEQHIDLNGVTIKVMDFTGKVHSQFIPNSGGGVNTNADANLAQAIADCTNGFVFAYGKSEMNTWRASDAIFYDEAYANVEEQLVLVWQHDTDPHQTRTIIIPAPDASLFLADGVTPDFDNAALALVVSRGQGVINDDGSILDAGDFHTVYGYKTVRKVGKRAQGRSLNLPAPIEPSDTDAPPDLPGENP